MRRRDRIIALSWALAGLHLAASAQAPAPSRAHSSARPASASRTPVPVSAVASMPAAASVAGVAASGVVDRGSPEQVASDLLTQARYLADKQRPDLVRAVLQKLLAAQPGQPQALLMLGDLDLREDRMDDARAVLESLEKYAPQDQATKDMQSLWNLYTVDRVRLDTLRQLHRGGREAEAAQLARELFLAGGPPGPLQEEFGSVYNWRPPTASSTRAGRGGGRGSSRPWVETNPAVLARQRGYTALGARDQDKAEREFAYALKRRPKDASTLAGLGIVRLRQGRFAEASRYFDRAVANQKGDTSDWREMSRSARYWDQVDQARQAVAQQRLDDAQRLLESARLLQPQQTEASLILADLVRQRGEPLRARGLYDEVLRREPDNTRALQGSLAMSFGQAKTPAELDALLDRVDEQSMRLKVPKADLLDAGALRDVADGYVQKGDLASARRILERGVRDVPMDAWMRYDLARIYQRQGDPARAAALMDEGLAVIASANQAGQSAQPPAAPIDSGEMRQAAALVAMANDREDLALKYLGPIDMAQASDAQRSLLDRARFEAALRRYRDALGRGDSAAMGAALLDANRLAANVPDRRLRVITAQLEAGQNAAAMQALNAMDPATLERDDALRWAELATGMGRLDDAGRVFQRLSTQTLAASGPMTPADAAFRDSLINAQARWAQRHIDDALARRDPDDAKRWADEGLLPWSRLAEVPRSARLAQADLWLSAGQAVAVIPWLETQVRAEPNDIGLRLQWIRALDAAGRPEEARAEMQALVQARPGDADVRLEAARLARLDGDYDEAMRQLEAVRPGAMSSASASPTADGALSGGAGSVGGGSAAGPTAAPRQDVEDAIARIEARRQPRVEVGYYAADRSARAGVDELHDHETTILGTWPVGYNGQVFGQLDIVNLNAGTLPTAFGDVEDFGKILALGNGADLANPLKQSARGYNAGVGWTDDRRRIDVGLTGINMPVTNVVGGYQYRFSGQGNDYYVDVSRRPVTSSLITYAGARDPITGEVWGGVTQTGVSFHLGRDLPQGWSLGSTLRVAALTGKNVETNSALVWRTTIDKDFISSEAFTLNSGLIGNIWHYDKNSNFSTFGHGNYYSPQRYVSVGVPLQVSGRQGMLSYLLRGVVSRSWTQIDDSPYYPTNAGLQSVAGNPVLAGGGRGGGVGTSWRGALEYQLDSRWVVGAAFDIDRSTSYSPNRATIYLRHFFKPQSPALSVPPNVVTPYSQF